jgi:alcohol dehydrogenase (cytochrome c)
MRAPVLFVASLCASGILSAQDPAAGRKQFESRCSGCHGGDGTGGELGPPIVTRLQALRDEDLTTLIREGLPGRGMPGFKLTPEENTEIIAFLRSLRPRRGFGQAPVRGKAAMLDGKILEGLILGQTFEDMQLQTDDKRLHLLRVMGDKYREVTSQTDWPHYNGGLSGNRYSPLKQITKDNVKRLAPKWVFSLPNTSRLQVTPVVVGGLMYVTSANECYALDAGTGRQVWHFIRPRTRNLTGNAAGGINRGVSVAGDRLFMVTDHAHIIALDRFTGVVLWDTEMADWHLNYNATSAPLAVGDLVVSGTAGGDEGARGFVAAFDQATGKEVWRHWNAPKEGEPNAATWKGLDLHHPGSVSWFTGSYDPELDTVYWQTGNPGDDFNGDHRDGDNLYSCSVLALDRKTGKLKWYYQFTPHDVWDWDATEPVVLVDTLWQGQQRKLLLQANRNGFFYVLDRTNGKLLLGKPFTKKLTWATGIGPDGRPVRVPNQEPTTEGNKACPAVEGAANWHSTSFSPDTGLFYVQALDKCNVYRKSYTEWQAGRGYQGGSGRNLPGEPGLKILRALDIQTGRIVWELPEPGQAVSWSGVLSTAGGVVIFGDESGALAAADASTGKRLWSFQTNQMLKASPMTYMFDGKQYVSIASGSNIISMGLIE